MPAREQLMPRTVPLPGPVVKFSRMPTRVRTGGRPAQRRDPARDRRRRIIRHAIQEREN